MIHRLHVKINQLRIKRVRHAIKTRNILINCYPTPSKSHHFTQPRKFSGFRTLRMTPLGMDCKIVLVSLYLREKTSAGFL